MWKLAQAEIKKGVTAANCGESWKLQEIIMYMFDFGLSLKPVDLKRALLISLNRIWVE
jgi:hypothetical protein